MVTGVTYYVNVTFSHAIQDVDVGWDTINGSFLASGSSVSDNELLTVTATQNITSYVDVYPYLGFGGITNPISYNITIETDNPGGGQSLELAYVNIANDTNATVSFVGLQSNTTYNYTTVLHQLIPLMSITHLRTINQRSKFSPFSTMQMETSSQRVMMN